MIPTCFQRVLCHCLLSCYPENVGQNGQKETMQFFIRVSRVPKSDIPQYIPYLGSIKYTRFHLFFLNLEAAFAFFTLATSCSFMTTLSSTFKVILLGHFFSSQCFP